MSSSRRPLHPIDAFKAACQLRPQAGDVWLARLANLRDDGIRDENQRMEEELRSHIAAGVFTATVDIELEVQLRYWNEFNP